jgi:hypothetical protein
LSNLHSINHAYSISDFREIAKRKLPKGLFEFIDRGNDDEIAIFNKMVADAKDCCVNPKPKNIESFISTPMPLPNIPVQNVNKTVQNTNIPVQNVNKPVQNVNKPVQNTNMPVNIPLKNINESMQNVNNFNQSDYLFASYDSNSHFESNLYNYKLLN